MNTQPLITTLTQIYEWEAILEVIFEQEHDTFEEALEK